MQRESTISKQWEGWFKGC